MSLPFDNKALWLLNAIFQGAALPTVALANSGAVPADKARLPVAISILGALPSLLVWRSGGTDNHPLALALGAWHVYNAVGRSLALTRNETAAGALADETPVQGYIALAAHVLLGYGFLKYSWGKVF